MARTSRSKTLTTAIALINLVDPLKNWKKAAGHIDQIPFLNSFLTFTCTAVELMTNCRTIN